MNKNQTSILVPKNENLSAGHYDPEMFYEVDIKLVNKVIRCLIVVYGIDNLKECLSELVKLQG